VAIFALISDIHANREALEAVLEDIENVGADRLICLGDVIGYGPDPDACLDIVAQVCDVMIRGNHDEAVLRGEGETGLRPDVQRAIDLTRDRLSEGHLMLVASMRESTVVDGLSLAHGGFTPRRFEYLYDADAAGRSMESMPTTLGAVGHTHIPSAFLRAGRTGILSGASSHQVFPGIEIVLPREGSAIVNPGSVGQPRDRNPWAAWGRLDTDQRTFQVRRVPYDVESVQRKIESIGLPDYHGARLRLGV